MVSLSFCSFMLVMVLLIFLTTKDTVAHSDQAKKTFVVREDENGLGMAPRSHINVEKEVLDCVPTAAEFSNDRVGGRKMMIERRNMKKKMKQVEADSKNSGASATYSVGNLNREGQGKMRELSDSSHSVKANTGSFVALNADYHMARPHPPKNN